MLFLTRPRPIRRTRPARLRRPAATRSFTLGAAPHVDPLSERRQPAADRPVPPAASTPRFGPSPTAGASVPAAGLAAASVWQKIVLVAAPVAAVSVGVAAIALSLVSDPIEIVTAFVLPLGILLALALGERPGPRLAAALALDGEALLTGIVNPAGMAFALVLPLIAVGLVHPVLRGRALLLVFVVSAATAVLGVAGAVTIGPARVLMEPGAAALTVASFAAVAAFALALNWRATQRLAATLAAAESEIVERIAAEGRLRETSEILSAILTSSPVATQAFDREHRVIVWNPASERTFGWSADELVGRPLPVAMIPHEERTAVHAGSTATTTGPTASGERVRRLTKDGDERWVDLYAAPLLDRDGAAIGVAGQMVDVTERVRMDAQLAHAQKMGAVGLLASGIAHDFNNTLAAAAGYAELIRSGSAGPVRDDATTLLGVVDRGRELTRQLLDFARGGDGPPAVVDLRDVVLGIEPLIRRLIGETVAVEVTLASEALPARIQVGQLEQSLINLAINGRDAMPGGGRLRIAVDVAGPDDGRVATDPGITTAVAVGCAGPTRTDDVRVTVSDSGTGIPPSVVTRIFEPFFTTKPVGAGTGLGLAMVRGFVETARGSLVVTSGPQMGTAITIRLPRAAAIQAGA